MQQKDFWEGERWIGYMIREQGKEVEMEHKWKLGGGEIINF